MRYLIAVLALAGLLVSCFALREHFRTEPSPCSINDRWDCGAVNHSPFAEIAGVPVAVFGILGYAAIAGFALARRWWIVLTLTTGAVGFSIYLTYIEARVLETYCIWCVTSAVIIGVTEIASIAAVMRNRKA
ncbi:MAG TPA: vitamin K epoxide reductase family protein [Candidatus Saccharimonadales bacterium]|nr:vitamin K epoxide reductase family protein [Candidatus Saccharimonadales bacterium]